MIRWTGHPAKDAAIRSSHELPFEAGDSGAEDGPSTSHMDSYPDGDGWRTIGRAGSPAFLFGVHVLSQWGRRRTRRAHHQREGCDTDGICGADLAAHGGLPEEVAAVLNEELGPVGVSGGVA